jgi:hypothetical protein
MALSVFDDKSAPPTGRTLAVALGRSSPAWARLKEAMQAAYGPLAEEWNFAGKAYGWSLRLKQKDRKQRAVVYLTPGDQQFLASFALGERACEAAHACGLPASVVALIDAAPKYVEGRGVRIPVRTLKDVAAVCRVAACKMAT